MVAPPENRQRIVRLTPLADVLSQMTRCVDPVAPRDMRAAAALGATLAEDIVVADRRPASPVAVIDGWAVRAEATADAGPYAPAPVSPLREVATGEALPPDSDAVTPLDAVTWRGATAEIHAAVTPGEGVLMPGTDAGAGEVLRPAGHLMRAVDVAALLALGIGGARVRRPRLRVARVGRGRDDIADAGADWLAFAIAADGGEPVVSRPTGDIEAFLTAGGVDAVVMLGGTGSGAHDTAVRTLATIGMVEVHGIAVSPGETAAFGVARSRPVLLIPGRLDAAVAVWLLLGRAVLARLRGGVESAPPRMLPLSAKVASTVGLTELVLVRQVSDGVAPIAAKYWPLASLAQADGWIVVPAGSEGLAPGALVAVRPLP